MDVQMSFCVAGARDRAPCQKRARCQQFLRISTSHGRCEEDREKCMSHGSGNTSEILRDCIFILRDRCSSLYDLAPLLHGRHETLYTNGVEKMRNQLARCSQLCNQLSMFEGSLAELLCFGCCIANTLHYATLH